MLIRSQDKKHLVNMGNVTEINMYDCTLFASFPFQDEENNYVTLGDYATDEKAIKVLDMIQDMYLSRMELNGGYDMVTKTYVQPDYWVLPKVFQMPKEEEVEVEV